LPFGSIRKYLDNCMRAIGMRPASPFGISADRDVGPQVRISSPGDMRPGCARFRP
jgi:hypothetical protein